MLLAMGNKTNVNKVIDHRRSSSVGSRGVVGAIKRSQESFCLKDLAKIKKSKSDPIIYSPRMHYAQSAENDELLKQKSQCLKSLKAK